MNISWQFDDPKTSPEAAILFRNENLPWYKEDKGNVTRVTLETLKNLPIEKLDSAINKGLDVEQITRVTGYFSKISGWNPGKRAELKDRYKPKYGI